MSIKLGDMVKIDGMYQCYGNWVRNPNTGNRVEMVDYSKMERIDGIDEKLVNIIEYGFDYFMSVGYVKAQKTHGKVVFYDSDDYEGLCSKILGSIAMNDFTNYTEKEIMVMAKVMEFLKQKIGTIVDGDDTISFSEVYYYLQFNMDYQIKDGVNLNPTRALPYS